MRPGIVFVIKLGVSASLLLYLAWQVDAGAFQEMLWNTEGTFVLLSLGLSAVMISMSCWKWQIIMGEFRRKVTFRQMLKIYLIGYYFNNLLPSYVGGDLARSYLLGERIGSQTASAVGVFLERGSGILCLLSLAILAPLVEPHLYSHPAIWIPALLSTLFLLCSVLLVRFPQRVQKLKGAMPFLIGRMVPFAFLQTWLAALWNGFFLGLRSFYYQLNNALVVLRNRRLDLAVVAATTVLFYVLTWLNAYLAFRVFGVVPSWSDVIAVIPAAMLVAMLPIAPFGSLGVMEASLTGYFALVGIAPASGTAMSLFLRFKAVLIGLVGFVLFLAHKTADHPSAEQEGRSERSW